MSDTSILERITSAGLKLSVSPDGNLEIIGNEEAVNNWLPIIRENKSAILGALTGNAACNVSVTPEVTQQPFNECSTAVHDASAMRTHSDGRYSATVTDASTDPVLVEVTIAGQASFTLEIPKAYYDGMALLELLEQHNARVAETDSVMSGLSNETQGIDSRRAA